MIDIDREKAEAFLSNTIKLHDEWAADRTAQAFSTPFKAWLAAKYPCEVIAVPAVATSAPSTLAEQVARARAVMATWSPEVRASVRLEGGDSAPAASVPELQFKDHNVRELVNDLRDIAVKFHAAQQLRARISEAVGHFLARGIAAPAAPEGQAAKRPTIGTDKAFEAAAKALHRNWAPEGVHALIAAADAFCAKWAAVPRQAAVAVDDPMYEALFDFAIKVAITDPHSPSALAGLVAEINKTMEHYPLLAVEPGTLPPVHGGKHATDGGLKRADGEA